MDYCPDDRKLSGRTPGIESIANRKWTPNWTSGKSWKSEKNDVNFEIYDLQAWRGLTTFREFYLKGSFSSMQD